MDYPIHDRAPDVAQAIVPMTLDASGRAVPQSAANPQPVAGIGAVLEATLALDTNIYADGDVLSDTVEIAGAFRVAGGTLDIVGAIVHDEDDQGAALDLILLDANQSLGTRNAAPDISDANGRKIVARIPVGAGDFYDFGAFKRAEVAVFPKKVKAGAESTSLFLSAISRGTGTYTASGVRVRLMVAKD
ncbi:MAG: hypothetical protein KIT25_06580 [Enhydrobacter sp.]|nr:MAG: hypothetical protein KIT25_06580 [Enhydrobacter sp.]